LSSFGTEGRVGSDVCHAGSFAKLFSKRDRAPARVVYFLDVLADDGGVSVDFLAHSLSDRTVESVVDGILALR
jgi:hypothetical protein